MERLGLTDEEVEWIRNNLETDESAKNLAKLYEMVRNCPSDPGARGIFAATLNDWRQTKLAREIMKADHNMLRELFNQ